MLYFSHSKLYIIYSEDSKEEIYYSAHGVPTTNIYRPPMQQQKALLLASSLKTKHNTKLSQITDLEVQQKKIDQSSQSPAFSWRRSEHTDRNVEL